MSLKFKLTQTGNDIQRDLDVIERLIPEYDPDKNYVKNDIVVHDSKIYLGLGNTTGEFNPYFWRESNLKKILDPKANLRGPIPELPISPDDVSIAEILQEFNEGSGYVDEGKPILLHWIDEDENKCYVASFMPYGETEYSFEIIGIDGTKYSSNGEHVDLSDMTFSYLFSRYKQTFAVLENDNLFKGLITIDSTASNGRIIDIDGSDGTYTFLKYNQNYSGDAQYLVLTENVKWLGGVNSEGYGVTLPNIRSSWENNRTLAKVEGVIPYYDLDDDIGEEFGDVEFFINSENLNNKPINIKYNNEVYSGVIKMTGDEIIWNFIRLNDGVPYSGKGYSDNTLQELFEDWYRKSQHRNYVISYVPSYVPNENNVTTYKKLDGTNFTNWNDFLNYIDKHPTQEAPVCLNYGFDSSDSVIDLYKTAPSYILTIDRVIFPGSQLLQNPGEYEDHLGEIFIVQENDAPNRVLGLDYNAFSLEGDLFDKTSIIYKDENDNVMISCEDLQLDTTKVIFNGTIEAQDDATFFGSVILPYGTDARFISTAQSQYGLVLPETTNWTDDREIATQEDLNSLKIYHHNIYIEDNDKIIRVHIVNKKSTSYTSNDFNTDEKLNNIVFTSMNIRLIDMNTDTPLNMIVTTMFVNGEYLNIGTFTDAYEEISISFNTLEQFVDTVTEL